MPSSSPFAGFDLSAYPLAWHLIFISLSGLVAFFTVTRDQDARTHSWYKNGVEIVKTDAGGYDVTTNGSNNIRIGLGYTTYYQGRIYEIMVYNMALSDVGVQQLYEATRMKYGM